MRAIRSALSFLTLFVSLCSNGQSKQVSIIKVVNSVIDSSFKYALYFPEDCDTSGRTKYPVILFLDPVARGDYPLRLYKKIADRYRIIMAGSFRSRNFRSEDAFNSIGNLYDELAQSNIVDSSKIFLAGFSGSARAVSSYAVEYYDLFAGVINCGAGFAGDRIITSGGKVPFASVVGYSDMNYEELLEISEYLENIKNDNIMISFSGEHIWPPEKDFELAVCWHLQKYGDQYSIQADQIRLIRESLQSKIDSGYIGEASLEIQQLKKIYSLKQVTDLLFNQVNQRPELTLDELKFSQTISAERERVNKFITAFNHLVSYNTIRRPGRSSLDSLVDFFNKPVGEISDHYTRFSAIRFQDLCLKTCLEHYNHYMEDTKEYFKAYNIADLLTLFKFNGANGKYFLARVAGALNNITLCKELVQQSVKKEKIDRRVYLQDSFLIKALSIDGLTEILDRK